MKSLTFQEVIREYVEMLLKAGPPRVEPVKEYRGCRETTHYIEELNSAAGEIG